MNIVVINHYAGSSKLGMEFRPYYLAKYWQKSKVNTTIIGGSFSHVRQKQPKVWGWQNVEGVNYLWLWTNQYKGNGIKRLIGMLIFITQILIRTPYLAYKLKPDIVIASSTYPLDAFPAFLLAKLSNAKLVFEIHDLWPLSIIELGGLSKWHPAVLIMKLGEWFAYKFANKVVSILPCAYEHVRKFGVRKENFCHIPNGIIISPSKKLASIKNRLLDEEKFKLTIAYAGSVGAANNIINLLQAANLLKDYDIGFLIIGKGPELPNLKEFVLQNNIKNVRFIDPIPKKELFAALSQIDILYIGLQKQPLFKFGISPNKLYDYMYIGKPIIFAVEAGNNPVDEAKCGFTVKADNPLELASLIKKILKMPKKHLEKLGGNGRKYVVKHNDYKVLAKYFLKFIVN